MFGNHGIFAPPEVSVRRRVFLIIDTDMSLGGTNGPNEQEGAMPPFPLPPVQRSEDQEEKSCPVDIRKNYNKQRLHYMEKKNTKANRQGNVKLRKISSSKFSGIIS